MQTRSKSIAEIQSVLVRPQTNFDDDGSSGSEKDELEQCSGSESDEDAEDPNDLTYDHEQRGENGSENDDDLEEVVEKESTVAARKAKMRRPGRPVSFARGKNNFKWSLNPPETRGTRKSRGISLHLPGARGAAKYVGSPLEAWSILITDRMLDTIVLRTNEEIGRYLAESRERTEAEGASSSTVTFHNDVDIVELKAFLGLLYYAGLNKLSNTNLQRIWSVHGPQLFRATMPEKRFLFLLSNLRFDDKETRVDRRKTDKFAPIRELWDQFIQNCCKYYIPHENCTIDEQLLSFRGRCPFRMYMPAKPDKYGMKIVMINDSKTYYMFNGKVETENLEAVPSHYVRKLSEPIHGTDRNLTVDNWIMSVPLANRMKNEYSLTMVGTIRKNKREIPSDFKAAGEVGTSKFGYHDGRTLVSYTPKKKKIVLLLSSLHKTGKIDKTTGKPEIIMYYNSTKGGTDTFDQLCHSYTTARRTKRWPLRMWYGMLDQSGMNALVLYTLNVDNTNLKRETFLESLAMDLIRPQLMRRLAMKQLRTQLRMMILLFVNSPEEDHLRDFVNENKLRKRARCSFCSINKDRKTNTICTSCRKPMCSEHTSKLCCECGPHE